MRRYFKWQADEVLNFIGNWMLLHHCTYPSWMGEPLNVSEVKVNEE
jgi:hypothetical protein